MIHSWAQSIICFHSPKCAQCTLRESATATATATAAPSPFGSATPLPRPHTHGGFIVRCVAHFTVVDPARTQPMPKTPRKAPRKATREWVGFELRPGQSWPKGFHSADYFRGMHTAGLANHLKIFEHCFLLENHKRNSLGALQNW